MDLLVTTEVERAIARDYVVEYGSESDQHIATTLEILDPFWDARWIEAGIPPTWVRLILGSPAHFIW